VREQLYPLWQIFFQLANQDHDVNDIMRARFTPLPPSLERRLACDFYKTDNNFLKRIFVRKDKKKTREFGKPNSEGLFKRLFRK